VKRTSSPAPQLRHRLTSTSPSRRT
jgi:hypothetical protein